jgi:hypothetical protein
VKRTPEEYLNAAKWFAQVSQELAEQLIEFYRAEIAAGLLQDQWYNRPHEFTDLNWIPEDSDNTGFYFTGSDPGGDSNGFSLPFAYLVDPESFLVQAKEADAERKQRAALQEKQDRTKYLERLRLQVAKLEQELEQ